MLKVGDGNLSFWSTKVSDINGTCRPVNNVVFIKTHKTGSTTLATIIERYGYINNLSFVLNPHSHILTDKLFNRNMAYKSPPPLDFKENHKLQFNIITNHARYSRIEMESVIQSGAKYITIIRYPVTNLESAFGYFRLAERLDLTHNKNPFYTFVNEIDKYSTESFFRRPYIRNGQMYDLGLNPENQKSVASIQKKIKDLSREFDLVLIHEYYDESLVLLKNLMCWHFNDIVYIPKGIRSKQFRYNIDNSFEMKIKRWSLADFLLYEHFNRTFWKKIQTYGQTFYNDLHRFRQKQHNVTMTCIEEGAVDTFDAREEKWVLVANATEFCRLLRLEDTQYWKLLAQRQMIAALHRMNFNFTLN
uniref:Galactosylceramide sulfotransferase-like n=1 Tax=Saccoglossus kowalevskii TaxID=10224 RepID=A0ABM0M7S9_SACKO|nr:PREDICTED: galactosylceramide sulfotransferase-like [Saccoglossus kowalevskii]